jgi:sensor histidine kinase YesM
LAEEIETLKKYVAIENARFPNEIAFTVTVAGNLNLDQIVIPPLLTQPFIENALWHWLSPKKGDKKLQVNIFTKDHQYLVIEIIDNGIGRKRAAEIKASRTFKRKSVGIKLSEERLRHFSKNINGKSQIIFEDLYDETGAPAGTKVTLIIPIKNNLNQN